LKLKTQDLERIERIARIDLEQLSKRVCNLIISLLHCVF